MSADAAQAPVQFMSQMTKVEYKIPEPSLLHLHTSAQLATGRIIGHKCPQCGKVYVPPRGYCPLCSVETTEADEVEVADRGTITTYSVITPLQYPGQTEKDDYVQATILLDGSHSTVGMQRLDGIPIDETRSGMRVQAVWKPESERKTATGGGRGMAVGEAISGWRATDEPDAPVDQYKDYIV